MAFDFAALKSETRRVVHDTLGVSAFYKDDSMNAPYPIRARWHNKIDRFGNLQDQGYAEQVEGIDRVVLFPEDTPRLTFVRNGTVTFVAADVTLRLQVQEPKDGPLEVVWQAVVV